MVFLVIGGTVVLQGASASVVARFLGLQRPSNQGYAILGANPLARLLARRLQRAGEEIVVLDANQDSTRQAQADGLQVVFGNAIEERVLLSAKVESRRGIVGLLTNSAQNLLFAQKGREEGGAPRAWVALQRGPGAPEPKAVEETNARVLFAGPQDIGLWGARIEQALTRTEVWEWRKTRKNASRHSLANPSRG
jgi:NhaP-type Na+/H+ or K+/H+ antiporter